MNPVRQFDAGSALVCSMISRSNGGKAQPYDFMPYGKPEPVELTPEQFFEQLSQSEGVRIAR